MDYELCENVLCDICCHVRGLCSVSVTCLGQKSLQIGYLILQQILMYILYAPSKASL